MSESNELWGGVRIPIIMVSGAVNAGKTLFGLTIDDNCRRPSTEIEPTTLVYDQEGSSDSYAGSLNFTHKDTRAAVAAGVHNKVMTPGSADPRWLRILKEQADCNDSPSASLFRAWYLSLIDVPAGKYRVGMVDTFTPLQEGLIDWLRRHPEAFGRTVNEYTKASSMTLWPDLKSILSHILSTDCRLRFETFVLTVHLKNEWIGGQRTKNKVAEGLDVLEKLATLHVELDRTPKAKGKEAPRVPAAILKKERLVRFGANSSEDQPILPPRLPECTPDAIRAYIASPPDFKKLTPAERVPEAAQMNEDDRLIAQQQIAQFQAEAEGSKVSALEMARQAAARGNAAVQPEATRTTQPKDTTPKMASEARVNECLLQMKNLFATGAEAKAWLQERFGVEHPAMLTDPQSDGALSALLRTQAEKQLATMPEPAPTEPTEKQPLNNDPAAQDQRNRIRELTVELYGDKAPHEQALFLQALGYNTAESLTHLQAIDRIAVLGHLLSPKEPTNGGDKIPF